MEIKKFNIDFVQRSKKVLTTYKGEFKLSILINCTLGLIVLPYENIRNNKRTVQTQNAFWDVDIRLIQGLPKFDLRVFDPIKGINNSGVIKYYPKKTLKVLLQKIRNGLAHQDIEPVNKNGRFVGVIIRNYFNQHKDLEVQFRRNQLKQFALFIADEYLKQA